MQYPTIADIVDLFNDFAPFAVQESYDNSGLIYGNLQNSVKQVLLSLDCTEAVVDEAIVRKCELVVAHHPILFRPIKSLTGKNYVERTILKAIKNDIGILAVHTNADNVFQGVNNLICKKLGLNQLQILAPKKQLLYKLEFYVPPTHTEQVLNALFKAGAGNIGQYAECSFKVNGVGTFKPGEASNPYSGVIGQRSSEAEEKVEMIFPAHLESKVLSALKKAHPYEEVAYFLVHVENTWQDVGSGMIGTLPSAMLWGDFVEYLKQHLELNHIRHTHILNQPIQKVAVCGGSGSFLTQAAIKSGAQVYITSDVKYHEFFDADNSIIIIDIGHHESEKYTPQLFQSVLNQNFPNIAALFSETRTNPVIYS
jgi:dinuclear metal center YbgI/SA1388 family protein